MSTSEPALDSGRAEQRVSDLFPEVVKRSYERALALQRIFGRVVTENRIELPTESSICLCGSVSRLECVSDSDIDYVLIWNDLGGGQVRSNRRRAASAVKKINAELSRNSLRPCDSFSTQKPLSELVGTENLFSRYSIISLVDSTPVVGTESAYDDFLKLVRRRLAGYAIGVSAEYQVMRSLAWYVVREGWMDQLYYGTSVNRFSRLIQLFTTILSINQFGIESTRQTKTTWIRIERLEPFLEQRATDCLKKLWTRALELKENRSVSPMLSDSGFTGVSQLVEIWHRIERLTRAPVA